MSDWTRAAFGIIAREIPGRWDALRKHIEAAPQDVQQEFFRVLQNFEMEISKQKRRVREPWRR